MKKIKSISVSIWAIGLVVGVVMCGCNSSSNSGNEIKKIGFLVPNLENPFFVDMTESAKSKSNDSLKIFVQASPDELRQNQIVENFITQGVDAICIVPINSESIIPAIIKANKAGIEIVNVDNKISMESARSQGARISLYIGSDNFEGGKLAGQYVIENLSGAGKVAILEGVAGNDAAIQRKGGFLKAVEAEEAIQVVSSQAADWNRQKAANTFQAILAANPDIDAVFACNDEMALGAIAAIKNNGLQADSIIVVGFDAIDEAVQAVESGELNATIAQQPELMGERAIELTIQLLQGKDLNFNYSTPLKIIE